MVRNWTIGVTLGAAVLVALVAAVAQTRVAKNQPRAETSAASVQLAGASGNLSGEWRLDPSRSEMPMRGGRFGRGEGKENGEGRGAWTGRGDGRSRGDWGRRGDASGDREGRGAGFRGRGRRLPALLSISQSNDRVQFSDSTGTLVQEILIGSTVTAPETKRDRAEGESLVRSSSGHWKNGALEVERTTPRGVMIQSFTLEDGGRTLTVRTTRRDGERKGEARDGRGGGGGMTLVYRKVAS